MEEINNNAVEKVENAINNDNGVSGTSHSNGENLQNTQPIKSDYSSVEDNVKERELGVKRYEQTKTEQERIRAQKRVEIARLKAHRKAEKQKAKATLQRDKQRRKAEMRAQKEETKRQKNAQRHDERGKRKERNRGVGGWLAAVISLGVATLVLASVLTFTFLMPSATDLMLESAYQKSFYSTVEQVDNIDLNLSKIIATNDSGAMQKYLVDTAINSELAENDLQQLPLEDESKFYTTKLVNQIGDFAKYLNNKLINGETPSSEDYKSLSALYRANLVLKDALQQMIEKMGDDFAMRSMLDGGKGNTVIHGFDNLENLSVEFPELIYDGPFSDGLENREIKGLSGDEITAEQARETFNKIFSSYEIENVEDAGELEGGIQCYNVQGTVKGENLFAEISKKGGKLIMFAYAGSCESTMIEQSEAIEVAEKFLKDLGINDMTAVWINLSNNVYTINFASELNDVIVYADLIKLRVCAETSMVIGFEATGYYTNHTERTVGAPVLSQADAQAKLSKDISVETCRLALVPIGNSSEKLCYEFSGKLEDVTYYIYIDALTGKQVEMFKVIKSTEGELLM